VSTTVLASAILSKYLASLHRLRTTDSYQRYADSRILGLQPICVHHLVSAFISSSPRILNMHLPKKLSDVCSIRAWVHIGLCLMVRLQSSDWASLNWLWQWYIVYGFRFHGSLVGREIADKTDDIETGNGARSPWGYSYQIPTTVWYY